jgi:hypothetical protein
LVTDVQVRSLFRITEGFRRSQGRYPASLDELCTVMRSHCSFEQHGADGWGTPVTVVGSDHTFEIRSAGPDRVFHTSDDIVFDRLEESRRVAAAAGCYRVAQRWWDRFVDRVIVLDTTMTNSGEYELHPLVEPNETLALAWWSPLEADSLLLVWMGHHTYHAEVRGRVHLDSIRGSVSGSPQARVLIAVRTACGNASP